MTEDLYDDEMRDVDERAFRLTGLRPTFVLGSIEFRQGNGALRRARGAYNGQYLVIQCDSATATVTQLGLHEAWHALSRYAPGMIRAAEERIRAQYDEAAFARVVDIYTEKLAGTVNFSESMTEDKYERALDALLDEIFADAYAGSTPSAPTPHAIWRRRGRWPGITGARGPATRRPRTAPRARRSGTASIRISQTILTSRTEKDGRRERRLSSAAQARSCRDLAPSRATST